MEMSINMNDLIKAIQEDSKDRNGIVQDMYCLGYYESLLKTLDREVPGVREYVEQRMRARTRSQVA
jgi:hypothetical protein